jgi:ribosomal protein S18 acetylase RimI-like enzyme
MDMNHVWLAELALSAQETVRFREVVPEDAPLVQAAIESVSPETLLHRFFKLIDGVPRARLVSMLTIDRTREACIVGQLGEPAEPRLICGARFVREAVPTTAEIALTVHDDFQRRGLGTFLLCFLAEIARAERITQFTADVMASNRAMLALLEKLCPQHRRQFYGDGFRVQFDVAHIPALKTDGGEAE